MTTTIKIPISTPTLANGDHLTRTEFERRYHQMPHLKKAELIEGVVYIGSPVRANQHGKPHAYIIGWLGFYHSATPGTNLSDNATVRLDFDNEPQPDALLRIDSKFGGNSRISNDDYIEGAPELIVEIAASTVSYDLHHKLTVYRRNGVQEYIVWRVDDQAIDWFILDEGKYIILLPDENGIIKSRIFPGLYLSVNDLLTGNLAKVLQQLEIGINSQEHQLFLSNLQIS